MLFKFFKGLFCYALQKRFLENLHISGYLITEQLPQGVSTILETRVSTPQPRAKSNPRSHFIRVAKPFCQ